MRGQVAAHGDALHPARKAAIGGLRIRHVRLNRDRAIINPGNVYFPPALADLRDPESHPTVLRHVRGKWLIDDLG